MISTPTAPPRPHTNTNSYKKKNKLSVPLFLQITIWKNVYINLGTQSIVDLVSSNGIVMKIYIISTKILSVFVKASYQCPLLIKQMRMTKTCHNHRPQTNPRHHDKEKQSTGTHMPTKTQLKWKNSFFLLNKMIAKPEMTLRTLSQNNDQTENSHRNSQTIA